MVAPAASLVLSLLGALALGTGVYSAPVEKELEVEEMVTRCIVEVLLNGLSKANAPPINPQCKELLQKNNRQKEEQDGAQDLEPDMMQVSESEEREKLKEGTVREKQGPNEEEFRRQAEEGEKWHPKGKQHGGNDDAQAIQGDFYSFDEAHKEETKKDADKRTEEDGNYKINYPSEEESKAKQHSEDLEHELQDKKILLPPEKITEHDYKRSGGQRGEIVQSQERENEESKEEEEAEEEEEEEEEESSEKYHHSFHREYEDSSERDVDAGKRGHKPRYYHRKPRLGNSSEYKRYHHDEKDSPEESSEEEREFWDKRGHYPKHYYETGHRFEEKRNSIEMHGSEEMEERSKNKELQDKWHSSREDSEEEDMRHHSREIEEKQHHLEKKRLPDEPQKELRHHYEEQTLHSKPNEEDVDKPHSYNSRDEKKHQHDKLQLEEMPKMKNIEMEDREKRFHSPEEGEREEKRYYPSVIEEQLEGRHHNERGKHVANKRTLLLEEGYPRSHYLVENVKRAVAPYIPYYQQFRWKKRHAEKKDEVGKPFLESEEEPRSQLSERDFFPEYNDYNLWEKKQLMDGLSRSENKNLERSHTFDVKRQYNKMDQLAHLLSNRKKSAEFPELYSSREDVKRGHIIRSGEGRLRQRPLTQEEEKELENLAAMDLELQKIAEKFNSNRRG